MKVLEKTNVILEQLQAMETFANIDEAALQWLIDKSECRILEVGENLFEPDQAVNSMQIILEGAFAIQIYRNGKLREVGKSEKGTITGVLPFSRMVKAGGFGKVIEELHIIDLHKSHFVEMVNVSYELTQALVGVMSSRIRTFSQLRFQDEKLMALGKMSAGLAHELNNPASAMVRSSEELYRKIHTTPEKFKSVITMRITPEQTDEINAILFSKIKKADEIDLSLLEREEALDDLVDWLEDNEIDKDIDEIADTFVDYGVTRDDLDKISDILDGQHLGAIMSWFESTLSLEKIVNEIRDASERISDLVSSIKTYSHMDRGSSFEAIDIHDGLKSTLMMLKHEFKQKGIVFDKQIDRSLPKVKAIGGELNQVWTNIIMNAIDAMDKGGTLYVRTYRDRNYVCVDIGDNGPGIPEDIQTRIFEPFFTTKKMGEGTGMGLDIVKKIIDKHDADIKVESEPGKTVFTVCFQAV